MGQKTLEVRGYTSYNRPASWPLRSASLLADAGITLLLISFAISLGWSLFGICPRPGFIPLVLSVFAAGLYWLPQKRWLGMTVGQRLWQLRRNGAQLLQCDHLNTKNVFISSLITTFALLLSVSVFQNTVFNHPIWLPATEWKIPVDAPPSPKWAVTPFFYTLGAWPTEMGGKTLFYSLLYEKGPPTRFVGHILAQANDPDIQIIIEGPKTPQDGGSQKQIRDCLLLQSPLSCILTREANLKRHVDEISAISPKKWSLKWFSVENKALFPEEQTQGIYLNSIGKTLIQDRFILVHSGGLQQTLILSRPKTPAGEEAFQKVQEIVNSL